MEKAFWLNRNAIKRIFSLRSEGATEKISLAHPIRALKILLTESASPGRLALAAALGVLLGTLPLIACHTIAIIVVAAWLRLNKVAAVTASQLCMPPVVPALCVEAGYFVRHGRFLTEISMETLGYQALERLYEYLIGSVILAPILATLVGLPVYGVALVISRRRAAGKTAT